MRIKSILLAVISLFGINLFGKIASADNSCVCKSDENEKNFKEALKQNEENVVYVYSEDKAGKPVTAGTGFVYDKSGIIATARHVVNNPAAVAIKVIIKQGGKLIVKKAAWHFDDMEYDVSILRIDYKFNSQVKIRNGELESGEELYSLGFPIVLPSTGNDQLLITRTYGRFFKYFFLKNIAGLPKEIFGENLMQLSTLPVAPGYSGAPVFDENGQAVGILTLNRSIIPFGSVYAWSTQIKHLINLAKKRAILNTIFP